MLKTPSAVDEAALIVGGRSELSRLLGVTPAAIGNWKVRGVPIEYCSDIEAMTGGKVGRQALRPNDWRRIWPELVQAVDTCAAEQGVANA